MEFCYYFYLFKDLGILKSGYDCSMVKAQISLPFHTIRIIYKFLSASLCKLQTLKKNPVSS